MRENNPLIEIHELGASPADISFGIRQYTDAKRQFAVIFDADGNATLSAPKIGSRNTANPQPTPPLSEAMVA